MESGADSHACFKTTRWTLVAMAGGESDEAREAMEELCQAYWFPLYAFARRSGHPSAQSKDLVQGFFLQVIEKHLFSRANADKGKLRTFLLTAFRRHLFHEARREATLKRGGGESILSIDELDAESWYHEQLIEGETPEHMYDRQWALTLMEKSVRSLEEQWRARGKASLFAHLKPFLTRQPEAGDYPSLENDLGISRSSLKTSVHRLRAEYRSQIQEQIEGTQLAGGDWQEEMRSLIRALASPPGS